MTISIRRFDIYRELYPSMSLAEKEAWHSMLWRNSRDQNHFNHDAARSFAKLLPKNARVLEYGGWMGHMAEMLLGESQISHWWNVEICREARENGLVDDRYSTSPCSPLPMLNSIDGFVASHVLEHTSEDEIRELVVSVMLRRPAVILVDFPQPHSVKGTTCMHIVGNVWEIINGYFEDYEVGCIGTATILRRNDQA